jgi:poly-gamma-glutamate synthesis protein (capsule biosynthesis protein)
MRALDYAGFDRCDTASNHILDRGAAGIDATLDDIDKYGLTQAGIARSAAGQAPTVLDVRGFKVAHLAYTEVAGKPAPPGQPWRLSMAVKSRIVSDVRKARAMGAEYVVVSMHDADELHYEPTANQRKWDEWVIDVAGADLVVGTGSHVPEPVEAHGRGQILFGLGNLINWRLNARDSVIARLTLSRDPDGAVVASTAELIPTFTDERLGYQVLDARSGIGAARLDDQIRADLAASLARVRPHVGRWIPPL